MAGRLCLPRHFSLNSPRVAVSNPARCLLGLALAFVAIMPVVWAASSWRRRLLPRWSGAPAVLVDVVLVLSTLVLTAEVLGTVGLLRLVPLTGSLVLVSWLCWLLARRSHGWLPAGAEGVSGEGASTSHAAVPRNAPARLFVALALTSVVVADWSSRTVDALHHGMTTPDTIWYHMPFMARFAQTGSITALHFVDFHSSIAFYPENGELVHALGIVFLSNDVLSPGPEFGLACSGLSGLLVCRPTLRCRARHAGWWSGSHVYPWPRCNPTRWGLHGCCRTRSVGCGSGTVGGF